MYYPAESERYKIGGKLGDKFQRCPGPGRSKLQEKGNSTPGRRKSHGRISGRRPRRAGEDGAPEIASRSEAGRGGEGGSGGKGRGRGGGDKRQGVRRGEEADTLRSAGGGYRTKLPSRFSLYG